MNLKKFIFLAFALMTYSANAALYTINNGAGATASGIQDVTGRTFRFGTSAGDTFATGGGTSAGPGIVGIGIFTTADINIATLTASQLVSSFQQYGASANFAAAGPTGARSVFSDATTGTVTESQFDTKNIYVLVGNGTTFANSSQFLVLKSSFTFNAADDANPLAITNTVTTANTTILLGSLVANVQTANTDGSVTPGWQLAAVPEPSVALLGAIGSLVLLRRRR